MLVSHRFRFIYTKTVKTAGTSVESYFERFCMPYSEWQQAEPRSEYESSSGIIGFRGTERPENTRWWNHMGAENIRKQLGENIWNSYFKFCVLRNPFEKCISAFEHFGKNHQVKKQSLVDRFCSFGMTSEQRRFFDYIKKAAPIDRDKYVINDEFCLDDIIRYESLEEDIKRICQHLGLPFEPEYLPTFKADLRRPAATIETLYTKHTRRLVEKRFSFEIKRFDYKFPFISNKIIEA